METCFSFVLRDLEQARVTTLTGRRLVNGPGLFNTYYPCWESVEVVMKVQLDPNQMMEIRNKLHPGHSRWIQGPVMAQLTSPWEEFLPPKKCTVLDQDDYVIVRGVDGQREVKGGPLIYFPQVYGEETQLQGEAIMCPVNSYLIINDADSETHPVVHLRGPAKWFPEPFQSITPNTVTKRKYHKCVEITSKTAVHLQKVSGEVILLDEPGFYMPEVGEGVIGYVEKLVLLTTDFCMVKSPDGGVTVKSGYVREDRAFHLKPFESYVTFDFGGIRKHVLSCLPNWLPHTFNVRTSDNVILSLEMRIAYRLFDASKFCQNPIEFYGFIQNSVQNNFLDKFAKVTLSEFMATFGNIAESEVAPLNEVYLAFGIEIDALQVMGYKCDNKTTQELLWQDTYSVVKQANQLRAKQTDVYIQEQVNEVLRKQKELEVALTTRDNEIRLQRKLAENTLRVKEMDIEIQEERKRCELLELKRGNDLVESEFEGRAKGAHLKEFLSGIDLKLTVKQKVDIFMRQCDQKRSLTLYAKASTMTVYPSGVEVETYQVGSGKDITRLANAEGMKKTWDGNFIKDDSRARGKARFAEIEAARAKAHAAYASNVGDIMPGHARLSAATTTDSDIGISGLGDSFSKNYETISSQEDNPSDYGHNYKSSNTDNSYSSGGNNSSNHNRGNTSYSSSRDIDPEPEPESSSSSVAFTLAKSPGVSGYDSKVQFRFKQSADKLYSTQKFNDAIELYTKAIDCGKDDDFTMKCYSNRSLCYIKLNQNQKASQDCSYVLSINENDVKSRFRRFECCQKLSLDVKDDATYLYKMGSSVIGSYSFGQVKKALGE